MDKPGNEKTKQKLSLHEMTVFAMLASITFCLKKVMEPLPNIHPVGMFVMVCALAYRVKGLVPLYTYIVIEGLFYGFSITWMPYLYSWVTLWGITMLLPKKMPNGARVVVYPAVCALFGLAYGVFTAPVYAWYFGMPIGKYIMGGLLYDGYHTAGNLAAGLLVLPVVETLRKADKSLHKHT